jgi:hypothetical protein
LGALIVPVLNLGIIDIPYAAQNYATPKSPKAMLGAAKRGKVSAPKYQGNQRTTGDVAEILEKRYAIMDTFFDLHKNDIVGALEGSLAGALENVLAGGPGTMSATAEGESAIETMFKQFLSNREMDALGIKGIPTKAAREGVSHRFKHPYARRPERPSFIDTGLYQSNFKAWVEN